MTAFRFRLDPVLGVRRHALERARAVRARAERAVLRARERELGWRARCAEVAAALEAGLVTGLDAQVLRAGRAALDALAGRLREAESGVEEALGQLGRAQAELRSAHTRVRALERLRERAEREHCLALARREQRELDEIGVQRALRASRSVVGA